MVYYIYCNISVRIWSFSLLKSCSYLELFWAAFSRIQTEYGVSLRIQSKFGKIRSRIIPNTDTFLADGATEGFILDYIFMYRAISHQIRIKET